MALTPDEIERRTFPIADWGYDRGEVHKFLVETAATLRYLQHGSLTPDLAAMVQRSPAPPAPTELHDLVGDDGSPDYTKVGERVSKIIEAAETLASGLRDDVEREVIAARAEVEKAVADRRREAEDEATLIREQAKRVLIAAQEQATRILGEAEEQVAAVQAASERRLQARDEKIQRVAQQHADRVVRFEHDAVRRLEEAQGDLQRAIERLTGSERHPVIDLSTSRPALRTGSLEPVEQPLPAGPYGPHAPAAIPTISPLAEPIGVDPVSHLVKAAVERAAEHSAPKTKPTSRLRGTRLAPPTD